MKTSLLRTALSAMHAVRVHRMFSPRSGNVGVILMLHRVTPEPAPTFSPNRILTVTPEFLETTIKETRALGFEFVSLDQAHDRISGGGNVQQARPFAALTFDDGYRDNAIHALPVLQRHQVPATIYVPAAFPDGNGDFWWLALEEAIRRLDRVEAEVDGRAFILPSRTTAEKDAAFHSVYWALRRWDERAARRVVAELTAKAGYDPGLLSRGLPMTWNQLRKTNADPLITIGSHTVNHFAVKKLDGHEAREEMAGGARRLEAELQSPVTHFSFPYGDSGSAGPRDFLLARELGFKTAVTTQKGLITARGNASDCFALKRLSLNGDYQRPEYLRVLLSGVPFRLLSAASWLRSRLRNPLARSAARPHQA